MLFKTETSSSSALTSETGGLPPLLRLSALELAEHIRTGRTTSVAAVRAHLDRMHAVNPRLNAVTEWRDDLALAEAEAADARIAAGGELPPLLGVPFTVKEMLALAGFKSTGGSIHHRENRPGFDATVVARLRAAGAIPLATTNVPELGFWWECENAVYGTTNNPYDVTRTCGGSSGGEGALVGAGASPFGLGSDIGGSVRIPAAFCGVFGHKPTNRTTPITGHWPYTLEDMKQLHDPGNYPCTSMGILARRAADLHPILALIAGRDEHDLETEPFTLQPPVRDAAKLKILVCEAPRFTGTRNADADSRRAVRDAAAYLKTLGATVEDFEPKFFEKSIKRWFAGIAASEKAVFSQDLGVPTVGQALIELGRCVAGRGRYTVPALLTALLELLAPKGQREDPRLLADLDEMRRELNAKLGDGTVLLLPCHPRVAPKHRAPWFSPFDFMYTAIFNVLGNPATAIPMGVDAGGLPLNVQAVAGPRNDHLTISVAEMLEKGFGGWPKPPL